MAGTREGARVARLLNRASRFPRPMQMCSTRLSSTVAERPSSNNIGDITEIESDSSFLTPPPDESAVKTFEEGRKPYSWDTRLPGNRYQYHPPKYDRGPLHPVQSPLSSDPTARNFEPGPFNVPRLKHTYDSTIAPDIMTLAYKHLPPGEPRTESGKGELREWDGTSPYHKNRPRRGPRGGDSARLGLLERDITWHNIPEVQGVTINSYWPRAASDTEALQVCRAVLQAISGNFPEVIEMRRSVAQWGVKEGSRAGAKVDLKGPAAIEFVDKLVTLVLPRIKDWPGVKASTGDDSGNLALGLKPENMSLFPELEFNYDMYPPKLVPGCHIYIKTSATTDRQARLLLEALGVPFYGKATR